MPAVVFKLKFVYKWHIGERDFIDYMTRPGAFDPKVHSKKTDSYYDYIEYMRNDDKSDGAFDSDNDFMSEDQIRNFREQENISMSEGCPKYIGVMSFDNEFLKKHGYIISTLDGDIPDITAIKNVARHSINAMIDRSKKLDNDNVYWMAAIHTNTDNIHVHYALLERHRKRDLSDPDQDCIEMDAIRALKSKAANDIFGQKKTAELTELKRQVIFPELADAMGSAEGLLMQLKDELPADIPMQYGNHRMKAFHKKIDICVDAIIGSDPQLAEDLMRYSNSLDSLTSDYVDFYGKGSQAIMYKENAMKDFYTSAGNILLKHIRTMRYADPGQNSNDEFTELGKRLSLTAGDRSLRPVISFLRRTDRYISSYKKANELTKLINSMSEDEKTKSLTLLAQTADVSDTAAFALGLYCLDKGDDRQAEKYLLMSANNSNADACYRTAKLYLREDKTSAAKHYMQLAADLGNSYAQFSYGMMLYREEKKGEGLYYLNESMRNGNKIAHSIIQTLQKKAPGSSRIEIVTPEHRSERKTDERILWYKAGKKLIGKDDVKAMELMGMSADVGNPYAQIVYAGLLDRKGKYMIADKYLIKAGEGGISAAGDILRRRRSARAAKAPRLRRSLSDLRQNSAACWRAIENIIDEYQRHIKQLQAEFDYEQEQEEYEDISPRYN